LRSGLEEVVPFGGDFSAVFRKVVGAAAGKHPTVLVSRRTAAALGDRADVLLRDADVRVIEPGLHPMRLIRHSAAGVAKTYMELQPGLIAPIEAGISEATLASLAAEIDSGTITVATLFSELDVETSRALAAAGGDRVVDLASLMNAGDGLPATLRGRVVVVVGHVEGDGFAIRDPFGRLERRVPFTDLEASARETETVLISVGCGCGVSGASSGPVRPITDLEVANALPRVLAARSHAELLGALGTESNPYVLTSAAFDDIGRANTIRFERLQKYAGVVDKTGTGARLYEAVKATSNVWELFSFVGGVYMCGCVGVALLFRRNRAAFLTVFPVLANRGFEGTRYWLGVIGRELTFIVLAPFISGIVVVTFLFGGWRGRSKSLEFGWKLFFHPVQSSITIGLFVVFACALLMSTVVPLMLSSSLLFGVAQAFGPRALGIDVSIYGIAALAVSFFAVKRTWRRVWAYLQGAITRVHRRYPSAALVSEGLIGAAVVASLPVILALASSG
jgi:hypothetical protein